MVQLAQLRRHHINQSRQSTPQLLLKNAPNVCMAWLTNQTPVNHKNRAKGLLHYKVQWTGNKMWPSTDVQQICL